MPFNTAYLKVRRFFKVISVKASTLRFSIAIWSAYRQPYYGTATAIRDLLYTRKKNILIAALIITISVIAALLVVRKTAQPESVDIPVEINTAVSGKEKSASPAKTRLLIAGKKEKKLRVYDLLQGGAHSVVEEFTIAIGEKEGRKERQNDLKTPEGLYWIIDKMGDEELPPIYGTRAFVLDYPNIEDKLQNRTGYGIWIHGHENGNEPKKTRGCIALSNSNIDKLAEYIDIGTPILIAPTLRKAEVAITHLPHPDTLELAKQKIIARQSEKESFVEPFLERWRAAWESKDVETYSSYYSPAYKQNNMSREKWKEYKSEIFSKSGNISIAIDDIRLEKLRPNSATIRFKQIYESGQYRSVENKELRLVKQGNEWKIFEEIVLTDPTS